jgi:phospholipid/cholesterol/gamma-HCH transport system substrate-binding protein
MTRPRLGNRVRIAASSVAALALAAVLAGCSGGAGQTIHASATFSDVSDLVAGAPVQFENLTVGSVSSITLSGDQAKVDMDIQKSADVPAHVTAELKQTTILGEHYVALVAQNDGGPALQDGAVIAKTAFIPGIQQLVSSGTYLFGAVNAAQLAEAIDNGAQGFGNESANLRQLLDDFSTVLGGYASRSTEIQSVIEQLDKFSATLAPDAQQNAQAISNLATTTNVLSQQSNQFESLLQSLDDLSVQGRSILDNGVVQTEDQIKALAAVADQLAKNQQGLAEILQYLPGHNATLASVTVNNFVQVLNDLIVCGVPGGLGGSQGNDASNTCGASG